MTETLEWLALCLCGCILAVTCMRGGYSYGRQ
jgi:hypothetical protein